MHWLKAFHVIAMVAWFAGLFYLPRLFVYHCSATDSVSQARFKVMEHRLYYYIMLPGAIITVLLGLVLAYLKWPEVGVALWFYIKIFLVLLLICFHLACGYWLKQFNQGHNKRTERFYRIANEIPTVLLVGIVLMVYVKP